MAYTKTVWKDRNIQKTNTFQVQNNPDGTITLIPVPGTITEKGTPVNASNLNKIEDGIYNLDTALTNKVDKVTGKGLSTNDYDAAAKVEVAKVENKADKNYVDENFYNISKWVKSFGENGYHKFPSGFILQWGVDVFMGDNSSVMNKTITFPTRFPGKCVYVSSNPVSRASNISYALVPTVSGFGLYLVPRVGTVIAAETNTILWFAIGY